jgi:ATP-dependent RNA helicase DDX27
MAPSHKRKSLPIDDDDFIHTISDNDDVPAEEEVTFEAPPSKKAKTSSSAQKQSKKTSKDKKNQKNKQKNRQDEGEDEVEEPSGIWGAPDEDDGAMASDFEFGGDNDGAVLDDGEFEGWGFEGAKKALGSGSADAPGTKTGVDLDEIIRRRREKKEGKAEKDKEESEEEDEDDVDVEGLVDLDDEVLAEDGFGMGVGSDVEEEEDGEGKKDQDEDEDEDMPDAEKHDDDDDDDDDQDAASDADSVATPNPHPDDEREESESDDDGEDSEEEAKRKEFFAAPEEFDKSDVSSFQSMSLSRPILRGLASVGFTKPTPIQAKTIPIALMGKDVVGGAVTGSGKTAAFVVPILERLLYRPKKVPTTRVVILTPTRELAMQCHAVATKLASHTDIKFCLAVGGLSLKVQEAELRLRPDVVIATPGRFIDHMRNSASFAVDTVEILVLDEADRMLEDGFADELNEILTTMPKSRQTMLFSATMTSTVDRLIRVGLNKPVRIMVDSQKKTAGTLTQEFVRLRPGREEKRMGYLVQICKTLYTERVIIFFRQKKIAHRARIIFGLLGLSCAELHGSMNQAQV